MPNNEVDKDVTHVESIDPQHATFEDIILMTFSSEMQGYQFFNTYAKHQGFSIRRDKVLHDSNSNAIIQRCFVCSREGLRDQKHMNRIERERKERPLTRCNCPAQLTIRLDPNTKKWFVFDFNEEHNHQLAGIDEVPFLRSHRKIDDAQKREISSLAAAGIRKNKILDFMEHREGGYEYLGFTSKDLYNFQYQNIKKKILRGDAEEALNYMKICSKDAEEFFYNYETDCEGHLTNLFWCDTQSRLDYNAFGDVLIFDSTYRTNRYSMPFIPFVGINHHRKTVIFGCGIVSNETIESYKWLLSTFLKAMYQNHPKSVITDGDHAMRKAIKNIFPNTIHRLCSWHMLRKLPDHIKNSMVLSDIRSLMFGRCSPHQFEIKWNELVTKYKISENHEYMKSLYKTKKYWAEAYLQGEVFLGYTSTQQSESLNSSLHRYLDRKMYLKDLIDHYELCVSRLRRNEAHDDCKASQSFPFCCTELKELEMDAENIYTFAIFELVQKELFKARYYVIHNVVDTPPSMAFMVAKNGEIVSKVDCMFGDCIEDIICNCLKLQTEGIPCSHIFFVLNQLQYTRIPLCCIWSRWTKKAKMGIPSNRHAGIHHTSEHLIRYRHLMSIGNQLFYEASKSEECYDEMLAIIDNQWKNLSIQNDPKFFSSHLEDDVNGNHVSSQKVLDPLLVSSKGAPKKRLKSHLEIQKYRCGHCKKYGHTIRRCQEVASQQQERYREGF